MRRTYVWSESEKRMIETDESVRSNAHYIQPDLEPFMSNDGAHITSRSQWREHLKVTGSIEMGHSDVKASQEKWARRKSAFNEKLATAQKHVAEFKGETAPIDKPRDFSRLTVEMANKLDGRPIPGRKEMIKLSLDTQRELARRGR